MSEKMSEIMSEIMNISNALPVGTLIKLDGVGLDKTGNHIKKDTICEIVKKDDCSIYFKPVDSERGYNALTYFLLKDCPNAIEIVKLKKEV